MNFLRSAGAIMNQAETKTARGWRTRIGLLMAIVIPTITVTGSFYSAKLDAQDRESKLVERISALEVRSGKEFADKDDLREIRDDIKQLRTEVSEIKTILIRQSHR